MVHIKRILVALDLSAMDEVILKNLASYTKYMDLEKIYFMHVATELELPDEVRTKYPDLLAPVDESIEREMEKTVSKYFGKGNAQVEIEAQEGNPQDNLLKWVKVKAIDLMVLGKKSKTSGRSLLSYRLAQKANCSVLLIPQESHAAMENILVPVDFSNYSHEALRYALQIHGRKPVKITLQHVYVVPSGYHTTGKSYEEFAAIMKKNAEKDCAGFLKKHQLVDDVASCTFSLDDDMDPSDKIYAEAQRLQADLIIMGSKGRTAAASVIIGSIAEKLISINDNIPMLVVKIKGENMGLMDALSRI